MTIRVATYVRVSTSGQTTENQTRELVAACEMRGWTITREFADQGISGSKGRDARPGFDALWSAVTNHEIDVVAVWKLDRLARSLSQLVRFADDLRKAGNVHLYVHTQRIDTTTAEGRLFFNLIGSFAEFERELIRDRINAGLDRTRAKGTKLGRKFSDKADEVRALVRAGVSTRQIRAETGVGCSMISRLRAEVG